MARAKRQQQLESADDGQCLEEVVTLEIVHHRRVAMGPEVIDEEVQRTKPNDEYNRTKTRPQTHR